MSVSFETSATFTCDVCGCQTFTKVQSKNDLPTDWILFGEVFDPPYNFMCPNCRKTVLKYLEVANIPHIIDDNVLSTGDVP